MGRVERERQYFDQMAEERAFHLWDDSTKTRQERRAFRARLAREYLDLKEGASLLEVGCAVGYFTRYLHQLMPEVSITAIDLSPKLLEEAKKNVISSQVHFEVGDVTNLPYPSESFDGLVGYAVLHHLELDKALPEIMRVLKKGGGIFFTEPNILNPFIFLEKKVSFYRQKLRNSPDETAFLRWQLKARLLDAGFKKVEVRPFDFLHPDTPETFLPLFSQLSNLLEKLPIIKEIAANLIVFGVKEN